MHHRHALALIAVLGWLSGCNAPAPGVGSTEQAVATCSTSTTRLLAGQSIHVGSVGVTQDETSLCVEFQLTAPDWSITEVHMAIATSPDLLPQTGSGNPQVGQFPYAQTGLDTQLYRFCQDYVAAGYAPDQTLYVATHAVVVGPSGGSETAWGEGDDFSGRSWAMYFDHTLQSCNEPPVAVCRDLVNECPISTTSCDAIDGGSYDPDGDGDIASISCEYDAAGGATLTITDQLGLTSTCSATVTVADASAPTVEPVSLLIMGFPINWALEQHTLANCAAAVTDNCGGDLDINTAGSIVSISSDEAVVINNHPLCADPVYAATHEVCKDIEIGDSSTFYVRNTRNSYGDGRVYTVTFTVTDDAGNVSDPYTCKIGVRLYNGQIPVDGPVAYTVYP